MKEKKERLKFKEQLYTKLFCFVSSWIFSEFPQHKNLYILLPNPITCKGSKDRRSYLYYRGRRSLHNVQYVSRQYTVYVHQGCILTPEYYRGVIPYLGGRKDRLYLIFLCHLLYKNRFDTGTFQDFFITEKKKLELSAVVKCCFFSVVKQWVFIETETIIIFVKEKLYLTLFLLVWYLFKKCRSHILQ